MRYIQNLLLSAALILVTVSFASAQTENDLRRYFEGQRVEVKLDMPASKDGIDVYPEREQLIDYNRYGNLLKNFGVGVREGDRIMITKIKVKDKHIEFQLGGGGYGTFGDETSSNVYVPSVNKSNREKRLERELDNETDKRRRRQIREELDYLRNERQREDSDNRARAAEAEEIAKVRIEEKRSQGGSRFNIKFDRKLNESDLTRETIMNALSEYVYFSDIP